MANRHQVTFDGVTFKRTSQNRTYTNLVVVRGMRSEILEAARLAAIAHNQKAATFALQGRDCVGRPWGASWRPDPQASAADYTRKAEELIAQGPIVRDTGTAWLDAGWCGRMDLAAKLASKEHGTYREVVILDAQTGDVVRHLGQPQEAGR